jgi:hypothetical protein
MTSKGCDVEPASDTSNRHLVLGPGTSLRALRETLLLAIAGGLGVSGKASERVYQNGCVTDDGIVRDPLNLTRTRRHETLNLVSGASGRCV